MLRRKSYSSTYYAAFPYLVRDRCFEFSNSKLPIFPVRCIVHMQLFLPHVLCGPVFSFSLCSISVLCFVVSVPAFYSFSLLCYSRYSLPRAQTIGAFFPGYFLRSPPLRSFILHMFLFRILCRRVFPIYHLNILIFVTSNLFPWTILAKSHCLHWILLNVPFNLPTNFPVVQHAFKYFI